jgi:putative Holliday junction resolvase
MKYLSIDYGEKKTGIAISDDEGRFAVPYEVAKTNDTLLSKISAIIKKEGITKVVMGESNDFKGRENKIMKDIRKFADLLGNNTSVEIVMEPEFLSSVQAERNISSRRPDHYHGNRRFARKDNRNDKMLDARAAAIILQSFLDKNIDKQ